MKKPLKKYKVGDHVLCIWLDACSFDEWTDRSESATPPCEVHSVGILVVQTEEYITLALSHDTVNDKLSGLISIPMGMIKRVRKLRWVK